MNIKKKIVASIYLFVLVVLVGCGTDAIPDEFPPAEVSVAPVLVREVSQWEEFTGRIEAVETVELRPRVGGYIERVNYVEGGEVAEGDVLFVIDRRVYRAALEQARAALARADSQLDLARTEFSRAERLADTHVISTEQLDQRRAALARAEADAREARAAVEVAALEMAFTEVRAPVAGRAGRALITAGNLVSAQSVLTTIVSLDPVHVYFESDERNYLEYQARAAAGSTVNGRNGGNTVQVGLTGDTGYPFEGVMDFIDNQVDSGTGTIRARAVLPNPGGVLTPGLFARVRLMDGYASKVLLIDDKAVLTDQDRRYVYVAEDGHAIRKDVQLGRTVNGLRVVRGGLEPGDRVIVNGVQKVFYPGMQVLAREVEMDGATSPELAMY